MLDKLEITFKLIGGEAGVDEDSYNPLSRALTNLLRTGQPFQRLTQCFIVDDRYQSVNNDMCIRWLGVFVYSAGNRIIFFPGFADPMTHIHAIHVFESRFNQSFQFDHFTLEENLQRWHVTSEDSHEHFPGRGIKTRSLGNDNYLWFGLTISNLDVLRIAKERTTVIANVPTTDARRRADILLKAREDAIFHQLEFHPHARMSGSFTSHFSVFVGNGRGNFYGGNDLGLPYDSPFLTAPLDDREMPLPIRRHPIVLSNDRDLQIDTAILPSDVIYPVVVTSGLN